MTFRITDCFFICSAVGGFPPNSGSTPILVLLLFQCFNPIIRNILNQYGGTIISVSHDRKYIDEVVDTVYELTAFGLKEIDFKKLNL